MSAAELNEAEPLSEAGALAKVLWNASRADEGTISATGANIVAAHVLASDWLRVHDAQVRADALATWLRPDANAVVCQWCHAQPGHECTGPDYTPGRAHDVRTQDARARVANAWRGEA